MSGSVPARGHRRPSDPLSRCSARARNPAREDLAARLGAWRWAGGEGEIANPPHLARLLPLNGEWRGEEAASQRAEERSSIHHSIT
jgi:hypothetical protein